MIFSFDVIKNMIKYYLSKERMFEMKDLGIDIGGTFIKYAYVSKDNKILKKWKKETKKFNTKDEFYDYLCADLDLNDVEVVGISAPGVISDDSTIMSKAAPNVQIMLHTNVNKEISLRLLKPVKTINDAKSAGYCEFSIGHGKGTKSSAYFIIGTGIGGCLCDEFGVINGHDGLAGEFSHLPLGYRNDIVNKTLGLSHIASMTALIDIYNSIASEKVTYGTEVTEKYLNNDLKAKEAMNQWCRNIIVGLYMIIIMYNPEVICIGGGISQEDWFIDKINDMMKTEIQGPLKDLVTTKITRCLYNNDANILGAVLYARKG